MPMKLCSALVFLPHIAARLPSGPHQESAHRGHPAGAFGGSDQGLRFVDFQTTVDVDGRQGSFSEMSGINVYQ